jgi:hypothetical protein
LTDDCTPKKHLHSDVVGVLFEGDKVERVAPRSRRIEHGSTVRAERNLMSRDAHETFGACCFEIDVIPRMSNVSNL